MKKAMKKCKKFFELEGFRVVIEKRSDKKITSEAIIKVKVNGIKEHTAAEGDGPVAAAPARSVEGRLVEPRCRVECHLPGVLARRRVGRDGHLCDAHGIGRADCHIEKEKMI